MTYFCPVCWGEIPESVTTCPKCGADLKTLATSSYEDKLLSALSHPVPENRRVAIQVLGQIGFRRALPSFEWLLESEEDVYVLLDVLKALLAVQGPAAQAILRKALHHRFTPVKHLAADLVRSNS